jgi:hypothetical protein
VLVDARQQRQQDQSQQPAAISNTRVGNVDQPAAAGDDAAVGQGQGQDQGGRQP